MHEVDGHELDRSKTSVDAPNELVDCRAQVLVFLDILARGYGKLRKDNLADPFRMLCQEELERVQLLGDTLDVVQTVNANDDLHAVEALLERGDALLDTLLLQILQSKVRWTGVYTQDRHLRS